MKKIILSAAVAVLLASPAFAQSYSGEYGTGNVINQPALEHGGPAWQGEFQGGFHAGSQGGFQGGPKAGRMPTSHLARRATNIAVSAPKAFRLRIRMSCMKTDNMSDAIRTRMCGSSCVATGLTIDRPLSDSGTPKQAPAQARPLPGLFCPFIAGLCELRHVRLEPEHPRLRS